MYLFRGRETRSGRWIFILVAATLWILCLGVGFPVPTPMDLLATPIKNWPLFETRPIVEESTSAQVKDKIDTVTLAARPAGHSDADDAPMDALHSDATPEPTRASTSRPEVSAARPPSPRPVVLFGTRDDVRELDSVEGELQDDEQEPAPQAPSPAERLLNIVAAGQRMIEGNLQAPAMGAEYSVRTLEEFIRRGWFYVLAVVPDSDSLLPRLYVFRPDSAEPLLTGKFTLADSAFVASQISQLALPVPLPELRQLFRQQVGSAGEPSIRVRARMDVARYLQGKQLGAFQELGFTPEEMQRGPMFTDGVLLVGHGRPVYRITKLQVGATVVPWADPEG